MGMPLLFMSDTNENDTLSPLETRVAFVGMMDETEDWARAIWRHNPQFLDFYKTSRLANIEDHLYDYDKWDSVREDYRNGRRTALKAYCKPCDG